MIKKRKRKIKANNKKVEKKEIPLEIEVTVSGSNTVEYQGKEWALSTFVKEYIPQRNASGNYQGPLFFSYKGRTLVDIRNEMEKFREDDW